jgi:L-fuconolactonase
VTVVDGHTHVFLRPSERYPRDVHPLFPAELEAPVEGLLETMRLSGVDKAVLVPLTPHDEYVAECLHRHPGTFAGIAVHDHSSPPDPEALRRRLSRHGFRGLRVHDLGGTADDDAEQLELYPVLQALAVDGHVCSFYAPAAQLELLEGVLERLPSLAVVLNHLGFAKPDDYEVDEHGRPRIATELPPPTLPTVERLARFDGVHVMISGEYAFSREDRPYADLAEVVRRLYRAYGAGRLMWASDYPWIAEEPGYAPQLALVDHYLPELAAAERAAILGEGAARRLYGL